MAEIDYYKVLQLDPNAEPEIVKAVYWRLSQKYHPDGSNPDPDKMRQINDAHEVIGDPARRKRYDSHRQYGWDPVQGSDAVRSPSYWKPPETAYNPDARAARKRYRQPAIPAPVGIFGALAVLAFLAIMLQSGFGMVQRAASSAASTSTPTPPDRWFATTVYELKAALEPEGFIFASDILGSTSSSSSSEDLQTEILIVDRGVNVKAVEISVAHQTETTEHLLTPGQHELIITMLGNLGASDEAGEFLADSIDFWNNYQIEDAVFQLDGVMLKLITIPETQEVMILLTPAP